MLDAFREFLALERTNPLGVITSQQLNNVVGLVKMQMARHEKRCEARAAAEGDDEEEGDGEEEKEAETELLKTACGIIEEILRQHGERSHWAH